jgi:hypothetical protein
MKLSKCIPMARLAGITSKAIDRARQIEEVSVALTAFLTNEVINVR